MRSNENNKLSIDPAYEGSLQGVLQFCITKFFQTNINQMLPAQVISYDRDKNRVQVQLLINVVGTSGKQYARPQLASIPVFILGGGNLMLNFPLNTGDLGWVLANDRDISLFLETYAAEPPNTTRMFSFSDGIFFPDRMRDFTINTEDAEAAVLSTTDGTIRIAISAAGIKITSPTGKPLILDSDVTITGALSAEGGFSGNGGTGPNPFILNGNFFVIGDINATGDITPNVPPP